MRSSTTTSTARTCTTATITSRVHSLHSRTPSCDRSLRDSRQIQSVIVAVTVIVAVAASVIVAVHVHGNATVGVIERLPEVPQDGDR
jgi:hypothetical protein